MWYLHLVLISHCQHCLYYPVLWPQLNNLRQTGLGNFQQGVPAVQPKNLLMQLRNEE